MSGSVIVLTPDHTVLDLTLAAAYAYAAGGITARDPAICQSSVFDEASVPKSATTSGGTAKCEVLTPAS